MTYVIITRAPASELHYSKQVPVQFMAISLTWHPSGTAFGKDSENGY
jgi:hypothetical protein